MGDESIFLLLNNLQCVGYKIVKNPKTMCPTLPSVMGIHKMSYIWRVQILGSNFLSPDFSTFLRPDLTKIKTGRYCCFEYIHAKKLICPKLSHTSFCRGYRHTCTCTCLRRHNRLMQKREKNIASWIKGVARAVADPWFVKGGESLIDHVV